MNFEGLKTSILIVDDDPGILETMADILMEKNWAVVVASDGYKAIEMIKVRQVDAIVMDIRMPGLDGIATYKLMKKTINVPRTIFMTAYAFEDTIREAIAEGAIAVLLKPIDIKVLESFLKNGLQTCNNKETRMFY
ncbi:MAG: response regulator [Candidatus Sigynarchaeota archaeon]